jgi:hypothetical protein
MEPKSMSRHFYVVSAAILLASLGLASRPGIAEAGTQVLVNGDIKYGAGCNDGSSPPEVTVPNNWDSLVNDFTLEITNAKSSNWSISDFYIIDQQANTVGYNRFGAADNPLKTSTNATIKWRMWQNGKVVPRGIKNNQKYHYGYDYTATDSVVTHTLSGFYTGQNLTPCPSLPATAITVTNKGKDFGSWLPEPLRPRRALAAPSEQSDGVVITRTGGIGDILLDNDHAGDPILIHVYRDTPRAERAYLIVRVTSDYLELEDLNQGNELFSSLQGHPDAPILFQGPIDANESFLIPYDPEGTHGRHPWIVLDLIWNGGARPQVNSRGIIVDDNERLFYAQRKRNPIFRFWLYEWWPFRSRVPQYPISSPRS